ncbi:MAG: deoxyhypusine synthase family protein [Planctomycetes bacterium]|nr:deoxyhypusine synthase family protein [Planctomycetota bacterium]
MGHTIPPFTHQFRREARCFTEMRRGLLLKDDQRLLKGMWQKAEFHIPACEKAAHPEKSFVAQAAKYDVPIYTSSPGDSAIGMNMIVAQLLSEPIPLNPLLDVIETTAIVRDAKKNGVVEIGG